MSKQLNQWLDEFIENGADATDVGSWPENAGGGKAPELQVLSTEETYIANYDTLIDALEANGFNTKLSVGEFYDQYGGALCFPLAIQIGANGMGNDIVYFNFNYSSDYYVAIHGLIHSDWAYAETEDVILKDLILNELNTELRGATSNTEFYALPWFDVTKVDSDGGSGSGSN